MKLPPPPIPALLNTRLTCSLACWLTTSSRKRRTSSSADTSHTCVVTRLPAWARPAVSLTPAASMSQVATEQPSAASWRTSSRPMPKPPPVTMATFPPNESTFDLHARSGPARRADSRRSGRGHPDDVGGDHTAPPAHLRAPEHDDTDGGVAVRREHPFHADLLGLREQRLAAFVFRPGEERRTQRP